MGAPSFTGTTYAELGSGWTRDPRTGLNLVRSYHGQQATLQVLEASAADAGRRTSMEPQADGSYVLRVQYGAEDTQSTEEPLATVWELVGSMLEKSVWRLPKIVDMLGLITNSDGTQNVKGQAVLRKAAEALARGDYEFTDDAGDTYPLSTTYVLQLGVFYGLPDDINSANPVGTGLLLQLLINLILGVESFPVSQFVLRRSMIVANNASDTLKPSYTGVNEVWTKAQIEAAENPPATLKFRLIDGYYMKHTPTTTQVAPDKWQVTQEWTHSDEYSSLIYKQHA